MALSKRKISDYHPPRQVDASEPSTGLKCFAAGTRDLQQRGLRNDPTGEEVSNYGPATCDGYGHRSFSAGSAFTPTGMV